LLGFQEELDGQPLRIIPLLERAPKRPRINAEEDEPSPSFKITWDTTKASTPPDAPLPPQAPTLKRPVTASTSEIDAIIERSKAAAAAAELQRIEGERHAEEFKIAKEKRKEREREKIAARKEKGRAKLKAIATNGKPSSSRASTSAVASSSAAQATDKDKQLLKLVGEVVVKYMSRYREQMDHDTFKKHAKEVCTMYSSTMHVLLTFILRSSHI
jgi:histone-lysine N-methyltransferase SETD2